jgi:hypothetical protein
LNQPRARFLQSANKYQAPPVHTIIISFATCGLLLLALGHHCPALFKTSYGEHNHATLPLQKLKLNITSPRSSSHVHLQNGNSYTTRKSSLVLLAAILALSLRVELYRRIQNAPQCTIYSFEVSQFERVIGCFWADILGLPSTRDCSMGCGRECTIGGWCRYKNWESMAKPVSTPLSLHTFFYYPFLWLLIHGWSLERNNLDIYMSTCRVSIGDHSRPPNSSTPPWHFLGNSGCQNELARLSDVSSTETEGSRDMGVSVYRDCDCMAHCWRCYTPCCTRRSFRAAAIRCDL